MKILVTGAKGFSGQYLIEYLQRTSNKTIYSTNKSELDLSNPINVKYLIQKVKPDQIYHLVGKTCNNYDIAYQTNVLTTKNIFDATLELKLKTRILLIGSAAEYGIIDEQDNPVSEDHTLKPVSIYGLSKSYQTHLMHYYCLAHQIDVVMARVFNLIGQGMPNTLFVGRLYEQIKKYQQGEINEIVLGNLQNRRDYISIEEAVKYYDLIMNRGVTGEIYNVGTGKSIQMSQLLDQILSEFHLDRQIIKKEKLWGINNKLDITNIYADITKLKNL
ncbi:MAG: NAD-dependent epimerase/dehydratase family protein [Spirochaetota bacterium]|nr:NAD-dependent epimerase/dehydratase family protein [Spirochaetota bacterium]